MRSFSYIYYTQTHKLSCNAQVYNLDLFVKYTDFWYESELNGVSSFENFGTLLYIFFLL
jgi:hypothetical protein